MTGRERVLAALSHRRTDRVPVDLGGFTPATSMNVMAYQLLLDYFGIKRDVRIGAPLMFTAEIDDDILDRFGIDTKALNPSISLRDFGIPEEFTDPAWGVTWRRSTDFTYAPFEGPFQHIEEPTAEDVEKHRWPKPARVEKFDLWREKAKRLRQETDRALVARVPPGICTIAQFLRGLESWLMDLVIHPEFSDALHRKLAEIWIETTAGVITAVGDNVDVIMFGDDFGLQDRTIVSPEMFRERIKPLMIKMVRVVKPLTKAKIALHTCGSVFALIDDFVDMGIDALNPLQSNAKDMDPVRIKEKAGGKMALWGGIDTHDVLPHGSPSDVRDEVRSKTAVYGKGGGYILAGDHNILVDVPIENLIAMFDEAGSGG